MQADIHHAGAPVTVNNRRNGGIRRLLRWMKRTGTAHQGRVGTVLSPLLSTLLLSGHISPSAPEVASVESCPSSCPALQTVLQLLGGKCATPPPREIWKEFELFALSERRCNWWENASPVLSRGASWEKVQVVGGAVHSPCTPVSPAHPSTPAVNYAR